MLKYKLTQTDKVFDTLDPDQPMTSTQISKIVNIRSSSVAGILNNLYKAKRVSRKGGVGVRGGYGWTSREPPEEHTESWYDYDDTDI